MPIYFEENLGQTDAQVKILARRPGVTVHLAPTEALFVLAKGRAGGTVLRRAGRVEDGTCRTAPRNHLPATLTDSRRPSPP